MSIGDSVVQLCGSGTLDLERNVVVSAYNGGEGQRLYGILMHAASNGNFCGTMDENGESSVRSMGFGGTSMY